MLEHRALPHACPLEGYPYAFERVLVDPAGGGSGQFSQMECTVLAVAGQTVALEAVEPHLATRLPQVLRNAYLLFDRAGRTIAFRGRLVSAEPAGDLRFVVEDPPQRRAATRVRVDLAATVTTARGVSYAVRTLDLGADGALMRHQYPAKAGDLARNTAVEVTLELPEQGESVNAKATVVRIAGGASFAVQFDADDRAVRRRLGEFTIEQNRTLLRGELSVSPDECEPDF